MTGQYRLKLFQRDETGAIKRPLYARFLLRSSKTERGMKILFQPGYNGALREFPAYFTEIRFYYTASSLARSIGYHRKLHFGQQFELQGKHYICLTIHPSLASYHKDCDRTRALHLGYWKFTENSLRRLRSLPILGFNPNYDGFRGAIW